MSTWTVVPAMSRRPTPWRNGLGTTSDVVTRLGPDGGLLWQVSIADLVQDSPFSHFPHCDRVFTPISGEPPPELAFNGNPYVPCRLLVPRRFSGEWGTLCRVPSPGQAFNLIYDRRLHAGDVTVLQLGAGDAVLLPGAFELVVHCLSGGLEAAGTAIGPGDSVAGLGPTPVATQPGVAILVSVREPVTGA